MAWKKQYEKKLVSIIGVRPGTMRAPGGKDGNYARIQIGMPIIRWSLSGGDTDSSRGPVEWSRRIVTSAKDGDIVLMHDLNSRSGEEAKRVIHGLNEKGILCVTVEELFADAGISLRNNAVYLSTRQNPRYLKYAK